LLAFKREFTGLVLEKSDASFQKRGIETFHGLAKFVGQATIDVDGQWLKANRVYIGTGARPVHLGIHGEEHVMHSSEFFELSEIPAHVTFIGGGYISMEFSHVVARFGSKVVVIDPNDRPLQAFDSDLVEQLTSWSTEIGIEFIRKSSVVGVAKTNDGGLRVDFKRMTVSGKR